MPAFDQEDYKLMEIALHEAGHGVIGYRLYSYIGTLTIEHTPGILDQTVYEAEWSVEPYNEDNIVTLYAGFAAQRLLNQTALVEDAARDIKTAESILKSLSVQDHDATIARLRQKAEELVHSNIEAIEAVAEALKLFHTLNNLDCIEIVDAIDEGKDWHVVFERGEANS